MSRLILRKGNELDYLGKEDGVANCRQAMVLNETSTLQFELARKSPKWRYFEESGLEVEAGGRVYVLMGEDGPALQRQNGGGLRLPVKLKELWYKLSRKYVTAYNINVAASSEFDHIDRHMVVLLGKSADPLYVNGAAVANPYPVGSAPYMFYALLQNTGWSLDSRYAGSWPDGTFDIETDKKTVLENLQLAQSLYGGMLLWDSKNRRVALVDENKYTQYDGFEARYAKNLKGIERQENRDIVTRLYPYGNANLNIAAVNGGREYLDNFGYTGEVLEGIVTHSDIYTQSFLLDWGRRQLEKMARPRHTYTVDVLLYRESQNAALPRPELGRLARVMDADMTGGPVTQRVIGLDNNLFDPADSRVTIGEVKGTFEATIKDLLDAEDKVNDTVSSNRRVPGFIIRGTTRAQLASDDRWKRETDKLRGDMGGINSTVRDMQGNISSIQQTATQISLRVSDNAGNIAGLQIRATGIETSVRNAQGDISTLKQTASGIETNVRNAQGDISSLKQTAGSIETSIKNMRGDISSIRQTANSITSRVSSLEGYTSTITQTATRVAIVVDSKNSIKAASIVASINSAGSTVKISADHINLTGYVTVNALKGNGTTTINGANIKTGKIDSKYIDWEKASGATLKIGLVQLYQRMTFANNAYIQFGYSGSNVQNMRVGSHAVNTRALIVAGQSQAWRVMCVG